jgi:hypothetical protein
MKKLIYLFMAFLLGSLAACSSNETTSKEENAETKKEEKKKGILYNEFKNQDFDSAKLEEEISRLMQDEEFTNRKGIYIYVLTKKINILIFAL